MTSKPASSPADEPEPDEPAPAGHESTVRGVLEFESPPSVGEWRPWKVLRVLARADRFGRRSE